MNKKHSLYFGIAVLLLAAIFTLAGCDNGNSGGGTSRETFTSSDTAGNTYIVVITGGDSYELTIKDSNGNVQTTSTGEAVMNEGGTYTLTPSGNSDAIIEVATSGNAIGSITGNITPDDGGAPVSPPSPDQLRPAKKHNRYRIGPIRGYGKRYGLSL
jgi:hypothetical protein